MNRFNTLVCFLVLGLLMALVAPQAAVADCVRCYSINVPLPDGGSFPDGVCVYGEVSGGFGCTYGGVYGCWEWFRGFCNILESGDGGDLPTVSAFGACSGELPAPMIPASGVLYTTKL